MDRLDFEDNFEFVCRCFENLSDSEDLIPLGYVRKLRKKIWQNSGFVGSNCRKPKKAKSSYREISAEKVEEQVLPSRGIFSFLHIKKHKETESEVCKVEPVEKIAEAEEAKKLSRTETDIAEVLERSENFECDKLVGEVSENETEENNG